MQIPAQETFGLILFTGLNTIQICDLSSTYNTLKGDFIKAWDDACDELGVDLTIGQSPVFYPPDGFEDRIHESEISTANVSVIYSFTETTGK